MKTGNDIKKILQAAFGEPSNAQNQHAFKRAFKRLHHDRNESAALAT